LPAVVFCLIRSRNRRETNSAGKKKRSIMKPLIKLKTTTLLVIPLLLVCFALLPNAQAFTTDPDDTFPNFNTAAGLEALLANTGLGHSNTAYGVRALRANTIGGSNVGIGGFALINNIDGDMNTAVGNNAMFSNLHGDSNMALGQGALGNNVSGSRNVAMGAQALAGNTVTSNTAVGFQALLNNTTGGTIVVADGIGPNTAIGSQTLVVNVTGSNNNAVGYQALVNNNGSPTASPIPTGSFNNAHGNLALVSNTTGTENNAFGDQALVSNVTGNFNTAIGDLAGANITANWNIDIGKDVFGVAAESFVTRIGISENTDTLRQKKCFIGGIRDVTPAGMDQEVVVIDTHGQLGSISLAVLSAAASTVQELKSTVAQQQKQIEALTATVQKVSAQLELNKPTPKVVANQ